MIELALHLLKERNRFLTYTCLDFMRFKKHALALLQKYRILFFRSAIIARKLSNLN